MNLPELCIRRPVMTTLLMAAFVIFGVIAYRALPVSELPNVDFPTISVSASLPGASPETMASAVATARRSESAPRSSSVRAWIWSYNCHSTASLAWAAGFALLASLAAVFLLDAGVAAWPAKQMAGVLALILVCVYALVRARLHRRYP